MSARDELAALSMELLHNFEPCDDPFHRHCCKVTGPMCEYPKHLQIGASYEESERAARKMIRELSDLDVRPVLDHEIERVRAAINRVYG